MSNGSKERRSHGEAVHRRRILAATRQGEVFDVNKKILETSQAQERLEEIEKLLSPDDTTLSLLNAQEREQTRASLEIEGIWLQFRLGIVTQPDKQRLLTGKFDELEKTKPDVYQRLVTKSDQGLSMAERIRDKVIPPSNIAGFYTKR